MTALKTPDEIRFFQLCHLRGRLKMEMSGMKGHGQTAHSQAKEFFGCKGSRPAVLEQIQDMIDLAHDVKKYKGRGLYNCCKDMAPPNWTDFDGFEIWPCEATPDHIEPLHMPDEAHLVTFWSVYGHLHNGGIECITDTSTRKQAEAIVELFIREHGEAMQVAMAIREARKAPKH